MKLKDIKIGQVYKIVGSTGGCSSDDKCINCRYYPEHLIKVTDIMKNKVCGYRMIDINTEGDGKCNFVPEDLKLATLSSWRLRLC